MTFPDPQGIENTYWATVEKSNLAVIEPGINIELEIPVSGANHFEN